MPTKDDLRLLQSLPLEVKVEKTKQRIREWVTHFRKDGVCVSFSGGKDSTVLLDLARRIYHDIPAVFVDTGLEYPEIREFEFCPNCGAKMDNDDFCSKGERRKEDVDA